MVEKKWASSFLYGLVPAEVDVSDECPNGIASATREISFLNGLVGGLTFNLYTPQSITVTCAAGGSTASVAPYDGVTYPVSNSASTETVESTLETAVTTSALTDKPVTVHVQTD